VDVDGKVKKRVTVCSDRGAWRGQETGFIVSAVRVRIATKTGGRAAT